VRAQLQRANLSRAQLHRANLDGAQLQDADPHEAHLEFGRLATTQVQVPTCADLRGAQLRGTELTNAQLADAVFDGNTELPDGLQRISIPLSWRRKG
jgi:uncharacterized protein YjbI with pentapeptide repeats